MHLHIQIRDLLKLDSEHPTCFASKQELSGRLWWKKTVHVPPWCAPAHMRSPTLQAVRLERSMRRMQRVRKSWPRHSAGFHMATLDVHADHMERTGIDIEQ